MSCIFHEKWQICNKNLSTYRSSCKRFNNCLNKCFNLKIAWNCLLNHIRHAPSTTMVCFIVHVALLSTVIKTSELNAHYYAIRYIKWYDKCSQCYQTPQSHSYRSIECCLPSRKCYILFQFISMCCCLCCRIIVLLFPICYGKTGKNYSALNNFTNTKIAFCLTFIFLQSTVNYS